MNFIKSMEAAVIGATAVAITSAALLMPQSSSPDLPEVEPMPVVVVSAKRMTLEEKLASLREERQLAQSRQRIARG